MVGEKPFSSASTPKISEPPFLGVAVETPSGWEPVPDDPESVVELEFDPELQAASRPPAVPTAATPAPVTAPRARNDRRSIRSVMIPLGSGPGTVVVPAHSPHTAALSGTLFAH